MQPPYRYRAVVGRVVDGDTIDVDVDMGFRAWRMSERLRLAGINAPETRGAERPEGLAAKAWIEERLAPGAEIVIDTEKDPDAFGRWIATIWLDGVDLNASMVEAGHAVWREY